MKLFRTIRSFLLFLVVIAIPPLALNFSGYGSWLIPKFWVIFFFIAILTFLTVISIIIVGHIHQQLYAQTFLAATTVKILATLLFALFFILKTRVNKYVFTADFFYIYFLNMAFEIYGLLCNLRNQNLK